MTAMHASLHLQINALEVLQASRVFTNSFDSEGRTFEGSLRAQIQTGVVALCCQTARFVDMWRSTES